MLLAGRRQQLGGYRELMDRHLYNAMRADWEEGPPLKQFTPKCRNLDILEDYSGSMELGEEYWSKWDKKDYTHRQGNGAARIIMDMSWPRKIYLGDGAPCNPNGGMKNYQEFEEVEMTSDAEFRKAMYWSGWPVEVAKTDWSVAYKHVSVCNPVGGVLWTVLH